MFYRDLRPATVVSLPDRAQFPPRPPVWDKGRGISFGPTALERSTMDRVHLFSLIDQQKSWLSTRQALVAQNIANTDTPGYRALDVAPFGRVMERTALEMAGSSPLHLQPGAAGALDAAAKPAESWETTHSGNSVSMELEMIKSGEIRNSYSLNTNIMRAFHGMWMSAAR